MGQAGSGLAGLRRALWRSAALGALAVAAAPGAASAAGTGWNMYQPYSESYYVRYLANLGEVIQTGTEYGYNAMLLFPILIDNTYALNIGMDTGSTGIVIGTGNSAISGISYNVTRPGWVYYSSSGTLLTGFFTDSSTVAFTSTEGGTNAVAQLSILIATNGYCINPRAADAASCAPSSAPGTAMMGVGFDRNTMGTTAVDPALGEALVPQLVNAPATPASLNPFLNLVEMQAGTMRAGYIVTPYGVSLGLTAANTAPVAGNAFAYGQLLPLSPAQPNNWQAQPMVLTVTNGQGVTSGPQSGNILMDTGVQDGFLVLPAVSSAPFVTAGGQLADGVTVTVNLLGAQGLVGYTFTVGTANPQVPNGVNWVNPAGSPNFFNSSLHTYTAFNVLYDAEGGFVGIQLNGYGAGTNAYVAPVLVANGLLAPASALDVDMPVILASAATVSTVNGNVAFQGDITGPGSLTVTGPGTVTLSAAGSYSGGTFVQQGTFALTGTLTGSVSVASGAAFTSQGGYVVTAGETFTNAGSFTTLTSGVPLYNLGTLSNTGILTSAVGNTGTLSNSGVIIGDVSNIGTLANDGAIMGTLANAGMVTGTGAVMALEQRAGGTLAPGGPGALGVFSVFNTLTMQAGSTLQMDLGPSGASDRVAVGGAAALAGGALALTTAASATIGSTYTLMTADSVTGRFDSVAVSNPLIAAQVSYGSEDVAVTLLRSSVPLSIYATTANERAVANALDTLSTASSLSQAVIPLSGGTAAAADKTLSGEAYASTSSALSGQSILVRNMVMDRARRPVSTAPAPVAPMSYAPTGASAISDAAMAYAAPAGAGPFPSLAAQAGPDAAPDAGAARAFWAEAFGAWGHLGGDGNSSTATTSVGGMMVGLDGRIGTDWRFGFAAGYASARVSVTDVSSATSADTVTLAVYGGGPAGALAARFGASYGWSSLTSSRTVSFPGFLNQLSADYGGTTAQLFGELALPVAWAGAALEPFAGVALVNVSTGAFTETGGVAALTSGGNSDLVTYTSLGLRGTVPWTLGALRGATHASLAWQHAFGDVTPQATFAFAGAQPFTVAGTPVAEDAALVEAGLDMALSAALTLSVTYAGQLAQDAQENLLKGGFTLRF